MRMDKQITLRSTTTAPNEFGIPTMTHADSTVFAEKKSVKRSEFYAAQSSGIRADIIYLVNADEYADQMTILDGTTVYNVTRAYQVGLGRVELTCTRR